MSGCLDSDETRVLPYSAVYVNTEIFAVGATCCMRQGNRERRDGIGKTVKIIHKSKAWALGMRAGVTEEG
jgi:hypothetical protein